MAGDPGIGDLSYTNDLLCRKPAVGTIREWATSIQRRRHALRSVRIGLLVPLGGSAGLWAPSAEACGRLAVSELNQAAGIMRRPVELIVVNAGETGRSAAHAAREAVDELAVDGLIGMLP
ncbi:MAG: ABC transporter substrate-binding protein, partial [Bradyrhizobium sp.]|nr:ABC transporter substrate-binding protein [Bradyrhizobium sp.]